MKKINVLQFITPAGLYGAEMWILALAKNFNQNSVSCRLAVSSESMEQNLEIYDRFRNLGLDADKVNMRGRFDIRGIMRLSRLLKKKNIGIIHTHGYKSDIVGFIAARIAGIKAISTPHGFENAKDFKLWLFIRLGCMFLRFFDRVAPLSEELESDMHRIRVHSDRICMIMNGVDLEEVESERNNSNPLLYPDRDEKKIGYVGQLIYRKNIGDLIKAFDLLYKERKNIRLILVGEGAMRSELEKMAGSLACAHKIEFLGYRDDRLRLMKEFDLFCMTSSLEGIPRCMMEAMAMGIPVAAYNIPGVDKLIINEKTGLMADFGDVEALKQCCKRLLFNDAFSKQAALSGKNHVFEDFSARRMAEEYTRLYQEMAG